MTFNWVAQLTLLISLVSVFGLMLGKLNYKGFGLGIGGVLFGGIIVAHFANTYGWVDFSDPKIDSARYYIQEFGLILFVYAIGNSVGPSFFASLKSSGLKLVALAVTIVALGFIVSLAIYYATDVKLTEILGIYSGAVTNTPAIGASIQMITDVTTNTPMIAKDFVAARETLIAMTDEAIWGTPESLTARLLNVRTINEGYAVAYPFGILGLLITMVLMKIFFRVNVAEAGQQYEDSKTDGGKVLHSVNVSVTNANLAGVKVHEVPDLADGKIACSRIKRGNKLSVPSEETMVAVNDVLHLVGPEETLKRAVMDIGVEVDVSMTTKDSEYVSQRLVVTNDKILGKTFAELALHQRHDVVVSRMRRTGIELVPSPDMSVQFGDFINVVGAKADVEAVAKLVGDSQSKLQQVRPLPIFLGIFLGLLLGSIAIPVPGVPAALKLGLAGGPLVMAIILSRYGSTIFGGKVYWFMPPSANATIKELGIVLFLACVGLNAGQSFFASVSSARGLWWLLYGVMITFIPVFTVALIGMFMKVNYLTLCGTISGACTDPPALAYANAMHTSPEAPSLAYATVYPFSMFLRILSPQLFVILCMLIG